MCIPTLEDHKKLSDNGIKFKNKLFAQVAPTLGKKQVFSFYLEVHLGSL